MRFFRAVNIIAMFDCWVVCCAFLWVYRDAYPTWMGPYFVFFSVVAAWLIVREVEAGDDAS